MTGEAYESTFDVEKERDDVLAALHVGVLAVERPDGPRLVSPIWYRYTPGGAVEFNIASSSQKAKVLEGSGRASMCAQRENFPYADVTVAGRVEIESTDRATRVDIASRDLGYRARHRVCGRQPRVR